MIRKSLAVLGAAVTLVAASTASAQVCPAKAALPNNGGTSGNARCPSTRYAASRAIWLITPAEMAAAGYVNGATFTSIGWNYQTAPGVAGTGNLVVMMENTADTTNTKSTAWATATTGMTTVHSASTNVPSAVGPFDITLSGGSPFTYTGGGLYIAYDWSGYVGTLSTTMVAWCNTSLTGGLLGANSGAATLAASNFRPETRLDGANLLGDAAVTYVYAMGALPFCTMPGTQVIKANIVNRGANAQASVPVTLNVTGADTFTDTQNALAVAGCGGTASVTFLAYAPSASTGDDIITVSVPADSVNSNNSMSRTFSKTTNEANYKHTGVPASGGVGVNGILGAFVAKFDTPVANTITAVKVEFPIFAPPVPPAVAPTYKVAIYGDSGSGTPSATPIYVDAVDSTVSAAGPITITLPAPVAVGPGTFFVGIQQTNTTNAGLGYDSESPIRTGTFFFATALPVVTWNDFAPNNSFKLNIGIVLGTACATAPPCPADVNGDHTVGVADLLAVIGSWGPCPAPPALCPTDINHDNTVGVADLLAVIGAWGACP